MSKNLSIEERLILLSKHKTLSVDGWRYRLNDSTSKLEMYLGSSQKWMDISPIGAKQLFDINFITEEYVEYPFKIWEAFKEMWENGATIQNSFGFEYHIENGRIIDIHGNYCGPLYEELFAMWKVVNKKKE